MANKSRSLTIRLPLSLYLQLGEAANNDGSSLNSKITQVLQLGLGQHVDITSQLRKLLLTSLTEESA